MYLYLNSERAGEVYVFMVLPKSRKTSHISLRLFLSSLKYWIIRSWSSVVTSICSHTQSYTPKKPRLLVSAMKISLKCASTLSTYSTAFVDVSLCSITAWTVLISSSIPQRAISDLNDQCRFLCSMSCLSFMRTQ